MKIEKFPDKAHLIIGYYDNSKKWFPFAECKFEKSFNVRQPSCKYPYSYLRHVYTEKYAQIAYNNDPQLYCSLHNITKSNDPRKFMELMKINPNSKEGKQIIVDFVKKNM